MVESPVTRHLVRFLLFFSLQWVNIAYGSQGQKEIAACAKMLLPLAVVFSYFVQSTDADE